MPPPPLWPQLIGPESSNWASHFLSSRNLGLELSSSLTGGDDHLSYEPWGAEKPDLQGETKGSCRVETADERGRLRNRLARERALESQDRETETKKV